MPSSPQLFERLVVPNVDGATNVQRFTQRESRCGLLIFFTCAEAYFGFVDLPISARFRYFKIYASFYYYKIKKKSRNSGYRIGEMNMMHELHGKHDHACDARRQAWDF